MQPISEACNACGVGFGAYSCLKCSFFEDDTRKQQYHCSDCGATLLVPLVRRWWLCTCQIAHLWTCDTNTQLSKRSYYCCGCGLLEATSSASF